MTDEIPHNVESNGQNMENEWGNGMVRGTWARYACCETLLLSTTLNSQDYRNCQQTTCCFLQIPS